MYGYVVPDKSIIKKEEFVLFNAFYCGLCKSIGHAFGQVPRLTTNYDVTFFAVLAFDQSNYPVEFSLERCIGNPFRKKALIKDNALMRRIGDLNMILAYCKAEDNRIDKEAGAGFGRQILKKHYKKAVEREPALDGIIKKNYEDLREREKANEPSIDIAADSFARMLRDCAEVLIENISKEARGLVYNIGKFVYLADALDDTGEDHKKKAYNPFLAAFGGYKTRKQFISDNYSALEYVFATTVNRAIESFNGMTFNQSYGLLENIIYYGLRKKVKELLESAKKLRKPKI